MIGQRICRCSSAGHATRGTWSRCSAAPPRTTLVDAAILSGPSDAPKPVTDAPVKRVVFTRSGVEFTGIAAVARAAHRAVMPAVMS